MIPILYDANETQFVTMGLGGLGDAVQCRVYRAVNGEYELEMEYPVGGRRFGELSNRQIILAGVGPDDTPQPFRIYHMTKPLLGTMTVYARHVAYDLMGYSVRPFAASSPAEAAQQLTTGAVVAAHGFTIAAEISSSVVLDSKTPRSIWSMFGGQEGSMLDTYKQGEWDFDHFTATLRERIGADNGVVVRYGVNLKSCEQDENLANCWTAVYPYWVSALDGTLVTLTEEIISTGTFDYTRILVLDLSAEFAEAPTEEQLRSRTKQYISSNKVGVPSVGLDVDFIPLDETEEYKGRSFLQKVRLGDSVTVEFPTAYDQKTGQPTAITAATARVVQTVWLPLTDKYESIRLGEKRADFISAMATTAKNTAWLMTKVR